jgi:nucleoside-diphosphate-sugar epimerase
MPSKILVTGGCGYLGSQLLRDLPLHLPHLTTIRILDNIRHGQLRALMDLPPNIVYEFIEGDLLDPSVLRFALHEVDAVVHLAAIVRTPLSFDNPAWLEQVNHWGTAQLVEASLANGVSRLIFTSSTAVYGPGDSFYEQSPCHPQGPYAQSKYAAEQVIDAANTRGLHATILRLGTLFGLAPNTRFEAVVNRFAFLAGVRQPLTVYGNGEQRRPIIHVRDAAAVIAHALKQPLPDSLYNATSVSASVLEIVAAIQTANPETVVRFTDQDIRTHFSMQVENSKLLATGWRPQWSLEAGVAEMLAHFTSLHRYRPYQDELDEL